MEPDDPARLIVTRALSARAEPEHIHSELRGGASTRRFFRVTLESGPAIAMYTPPPSAELASARQARGTRSFEEVHALLQSARIPVPKIFGPAFEEEVLFVEDLGDDTLAEYLLKDPSAREALYQKAVSDLARAQNALVDLPAGSVVKTRRFDEDLLLWEVMHFKDWALEARGVHLSESARRVFDESARWLSAHISSWPAGFTHRDYQSKNLMVRKEGAALSLIWIDFQDAMMGPRTYDLVALLMDSYQDLDDSFISARLDEYCQLRGLSAEREQIGIEFDLMSVQRKLKDAGRFIFLDRVGKNPNFLAYVDSTIARARRALFRVRSHGPLAELDDLLASLDLPESSSGLSGARTKT